jgi:hypothetical protein
MPIVLFFLLCAPCMYEIISYSFSFWEGCWNMVSPKTFVRPFMNPKAPYCIRAWKSMTIQIKKIVIGGKLGLSLYKFTLHKAWKLLKGPSKRRWMKTWHWILSDSLYSKFYSWKPIYPTWRRRLQHIYLGLSKAWIFLMMSQWKMEKKKHYLRVHGQGPSSNN